MIYKLQLDFDEPIQHFTDLHLLVAELKRADHIFIFSDFDDKYKEMTEDCCIDPAKTPLYIETSVSPEGVFVESESFWIENYMLDEFSNPEKRPYVETYSE